MKTQRRLPGVGRGPRWAGGGGSWEKVPGRRCWCLRLDRDIDVEESWRPAPCREGAPGVTLGQQKRTPGGRGRGVGEGGGARQSCRAQGGPCSCLEAATALLRTAFDGTPNKGQQAPAALEPAPPTTPEPQKPRARLHLTSRPLWTSLLFLSSKINKRTKNRKDENTRKNWQQYKQT